DEEPLAECWRGGHEWLRPRELGSSCLDHAGRPAVGPGSGLRSTGGVRSGRFLGEVLFRSAAGSRARRVRGTRPASRGAAVQGGGRVIPVTFYTAGHSVTPSHLVSFMAEELETAQIPPHIMAAMRERMKMAQMIDRDTAVVWRGPLKIKALKQMLSDVEWGDLDYLVIDLPPGTSDEPLSVAQEIPDADGAVVVTTPPEVSLLDVRKSIAFAKAVKMDILGVIENMSGFVCPHCGKQTDIFKIGGGEAAAKELGLPFL